MESKMGNPTLFQGDKPCTSAHIRMHIQSKTMMTWSLQICLKEIALSKNTFQKIILKTLPQKLHLKKDF